MNEILIRHLFVSEMMDLKKKMLFFGFRQGTLKLANCSSRKVPPTGALSAPQHSASVAAVRQVCGGRDVVPAQHEARRWSHGHRGGCCRNHVEIDRS